MPEHNGIDISHYQDTVFDYLSNQFVEAPIHWDEVVADPRKFEYVFIKAAHGAAVPGVHPDAYPRAVYLRQYNGAGKVGIKRAPYHYWYYSLNGVVINPKEQALAFFQSVGPEKGELAPLADVEDDVRKYLDFTDVTSANKALSFAIKLASSVLEYLDEISRLFGRSAIMYSGPWWWNPLAFWIINYPAAFPGILARFQKYLYFAADYSGPLDKSDGLTAFLHQYTSSPTVPVPGFYVPDANGRYGTRIDMIKWVADEASYAKFIGTTTPPPVAAWDVSITEWARTKGYIGPDPA